MSIDINNAGEASLYDRANLTPMRIVLILLFGGLLMGLLRTVAGGRPRLQAPRRRRPLLTVEEAVRLRL
jgi:hypothetical protein